MAPNQDRSATRAVGKTVRSFSRHYRENEFGERIRIGRQKPTFEQAALFERTDGEQATELASAFFGDPLEWQRHVLDVMLARDARDKYLFHTVGIAIPRQNGKSWDVRARCFYGLITAGEKILYTCQHGDTADEMFKALSAPFEDEDNEELHELLVAVRKTNGQQAIYLANGGTIRFTTRTNSLARGKSYDVLIYDEAQDLTKAQQAASLPTISASAKHNTQTIYIGTPPDSKAPGEVFKPMHDRVHAGEAPKTAWMEWAAPDVQDPHDRDWWCETNPSLGILIDEAAIEGEADQFAPDDFARERLGWWDANIVQFDAAIPGYQWDECATGSPPSDGKRSFGVKFAPEGDRAAVAICQIPHGGLPFVELVGDYAMPGKLSDMAAFLAGQEEKTAEIRIDGKAHSKALCDELSALGVSRRVYATCTAEEVTAAASMFTAKVENGGVQHIACIVEDALSASVKGCARRTIGSSGAWGLGDGTERSYMAEAASLALYANETTRRDPEGGMSVWW